MKKVLITQEVFDANPILQEIGAQVGQTMEYEFVSSEEKANESATAETDDTGGGNPPENKEKPGKPE